MGKLEKLLPTFFLCGLVIFLLSGAEGSHASRPKRLFVFGDSYADTGNINKSVGDSWKIPYGTTFPGIPSGRFSDGRVLTDFIAKFLGLKSPIPYTWRTLAPKKAKHGVNFAFGGTGVFNTTATMKLGLPNMATQIDFFQQMLSGNDVDGDLTDSLAFVSLVGNDYNTFLTTGGSLEDLPSFIPKVVNQLALNLQRIYSLGLKKILVTGLQPLGCVPQNTLASSFQQCNDTENSAVQLHNLLLQQAVAKLNNHTQVHYNTSEPPIDVLDLYNSFFTAFKAKDKESGSLLFENPLKPCCMGINVSLSCSSVDTNGNNLYTLCDDPESMFFWDSYHPTQAGWQALYADLKPTLQQILRY